MSINREWYHVIPNLKGGWDIVKESVRHSLGHFLLKQEAVDAARKMVVEHGSKLLIHRKNGKIQ